MCSEHVYLPALRAECRQTTVGRGMRSLGVAARRRRCKTNPQPRETTSWEFWSFWVKLSATFKPDFRECLAKLRESFAKVDGLPRQFSDMRANVSSRVVCCTACELELRKFTLCTTLVLRSCDFRAGASKGYFVYYV